MKNIFLILTFVIAGGLAYNPLSADGCYNCSSSSSNGCEQCRYGSSDTFEMRKKCKAAGCDITGTSSCSTAANVKVCTAMKPKTQFEKFLASLK